MTPAAARKPIGALLRTARQDAGITQDEAARQLGTASETLSTWETDRRVPSPMFRAQLEALYGWEPGYLTEKLTGRRPTTILSATRAQSPDDLARLTNELVDEVARLRAEVERLRAERTELVAEPAPTARRRTGRR